MIDYILFILMTLCFVFVSLSVYFIFMMKEFEDKRLKNSINLLLLGLSSLGVFLLVKSLEYGLNLFFSDNITYYANLFELIGISLMVMFFLVGMILMREVK